MSPGDELVTPWPSYPLYPLMARAAGGRAVPVPAMDVDEMFAAVGERTRVIALCNPNDPNGAYLPGGRAAAPARAPAGARHACCWTRRWATSSTPSRPGSSLALLDDFPRLLVFRTFSKVYGLAGMRCGYVLGGPDTEPLLEQIAPALGVSDLVQTGALEALHKCGPLVERRRQAVLVERHRLLESLGSMPSTPDLLRPTSSGCARPAYPTASWRRACAAPPSSCTRAPSTASPTTSARRSNPPRRRTGCSAPCGARPRPPPRTRPRSGGAACPSSARGSCARRGCVPSRRRSA